MFVLISFMLKNGLKLPGQSGQTCSMGVAGRLNGTILPCTLRYSCSWLTKGLWHLPVIVISRAPQGDIEDYCVFAHNFRGVVLFQSQAFLLHAKLLISLALSGSLYKWSCANKLKKEAKRSGHVKKNGVLCYWRDFEQICSSIKSGFLSLYREVN